MKKLLLFVIIIIGLFLFSIIALPTTVDKIAEKYGFDLAIENLRNAINKILRNVPSKEETYSGALEVKEVIFDGLDYTKDKVDNLRNFLSGAEDTIDTLQEGYSEVKDYITSNSGTINEINNLINTTTGTIDEVTNFINSNSGTIEDIKNLISTNTGTTEITDEVNNSGSLD